MKEKLPVKMYYFAMNVFFVLKRSGSLLSMLCIPGWHHSSAQSPSGVLPHSEGRSDLQGAYKAQTLLVVPLSWVLWFLSDKLPLASHFPPHGSPSRMGACRHILTSWPCTSLSLSLRSSLSIYPPVDSLCLSWNGPFSEFWPPFPPTPGAPYAPSLLYFFPWSLPSCNSALIYC